MTDENETYEEDRKLFVGGLPQEATQDELKDYFEKFGEIEQVKLKMDPVTGRSRGFAFLLYKDVESIANAADGSEHKIKGKTITVKKADIKQGKVYVGKLPETGCDEEDIKNHFSQYGAIAEVIRPIDKTKNNEPKNFCFVTFERERVAKKLIEEGSAVINGHKMQIKQVTPNPRDPAHRGGNGGMRGGRGGMGRGGYGGSPWMNQGGGYGGGWGGDQGYGGGQWGGPGNYGAGQGYPGAQWGGDGSYGMGGGYGGDGGYGGYGDGSEGGYGGMGGGRGGGMGMGGGKMRGGRGGRGRGGRGRPY